MSTKTIVAPDVVIASTSSDRAVFAAHLEGDAVLSCSGELDPATNPAFRRSLRHLVGLAPDRVVVDLRGVSFFDAGAIGELLRARNASRAGGGDLVVRAPTPFGRRVLGLVGLTDLIAEEPRRDTAPGRAPLDLGASGPELVAAWTSACATARYGAAPLGWDPTAAAAAITALGDDPRAVDRFAAALASAALRREELSPAAAVMQLWALRDVLSTSVEANLRRVDLEAALAGVASTALTELDHDRARHRSSRGRTDGSLPPPRALVEPTVALAGRIAAASRSSAVIDEAKGLLAEHLGIDIDEAADVLRVLAAEQDQSVLAAAVALVDRTIAVATSVSVRPGRPTAADGDTGWGASGRATSRGS